jgi:dGTPase
MPPRQGEPVGREVIDWLSGMTDRFAIATWEEIYVPRPWSVL